MERLKHNEIKEYRDILLRYQNFRCPLCQNTISNGDAVLDHDHRTGLVRGVLHRSCNRGEGKVAYWVNAVKMVQTNDFLSNLIAYYKVDYSKRPIHPTHKKK